MSQNSKIEWTHHTANLWHGCTKVHEGCDNCYAETLAKRWGNDIWGNDKPRKEIKSVWNELLKMQKSAKAVNEIHRVFVGSMMDIFEKPMPIIGAAIPEYTTGVLRDRFFEQIEKGWYPNLQFLLLTKRSPNIHKYIPESWNENPPANVMYGYSPVNPATMMNVEALTQVKGKHFLSIEPQLNHIGLSNFVGANDIEGHRIDWIIQGGESGHHKRLFDLEWARSMRGECAVLGVPYFFKQIDQIRQIPADLQVREFPTEAVSSAFC